MDEGSSVPLIASRCVSVCDLARTAGALLTEVERDGRTIALARYGRMVALIVPLPKRFMLEIEEGCKPEDHAARAHRDLAEIEELDLSELARQFLVDAGSTPTGYWWVPESIRLARSLEVMRTLMQLDAAGLTAGDGQVRRLTARGRGVRRMLIAGGQRGCGQLDGLLGA